LPLGILIQAASPSNSSRTDSVFINPFMNELRADIEARSAFQITFIKDVTHQLKSLATNLLNWLKQIIKVDHTAISRWQRLNKCLVEHHDVMCCLVDHKNVMIVEHDK
jgi:hypothetical protein